MRRKKTVDLFKKSRKMNASHCIDMSTGRVSIKVDLPEDSPFISVTIPLSKEEVTPQPSRKHPRSESQEKDLQKLCSNCENKIADSKLEPCGHHVYCGDCLENDLVSECSNCKAEFEGYCVDQPKKPLVPKRLKLDLE